MIHVKGQAAKRLQANPVEKKYEVLGVHAEYQRVE